MNTAELLAEYPTEAEAHAVIGRALTLGLAGVHRTAVANRYDTLDGRPRGRTPTGAVNTYLLTLDVGRPRDDQAANVIRLRHACARCSAYLDAAELAAVGHEVLAAPPHHASPTGTMALLEHYLDAHQRRGPTVGTYIDGP